MKNKYFEYGSGDSEEFNNLPIEERTKIIKYANKMKVLVMEQEKTIITRHYKACIKEISDWQDNLINWNGK